jgi:hypothetical protein
MLFGNFDDRISGFGQKINNGFEDLVFLFGKDKAVINLKTRIEFQIVPPQTGFFFDFPNGGHIRAFFFLKLAFREIPILAAVVEQQKLRPIFSFPKNYYPGGNFTH